MARNSLSDYLQAHTFHIFDVAPVDGFGIPIFTPLAGFASITMPQIIMDIEEVHESNWYYKTKLAKSADVSNMILTRGSTIFNSDMWRWMNAAVRGDTSVTSLAGTPVSIGGISPRRTLILVHFLAHGFLNSSNQTAGLTEGLAFAGFAAGGGGFATGGLTGGLSSLGAAAASGGISAGIGAVLGGNDFAFRAPVKAWMLSGCLPVRYKPGSDFDAMSGSVSIQELEISVETLEELSLAG